MDCHEPNRSCDDSERKFANLKKDKFANSTNLQIYNPNLSLSSKLWHWLLEKSLFWEFMDCLLASFMLSCKKNLFQPTISCLLKNVAFRLSSSLLKFSKHFLSLKSPKTTLFSSIFSESFCGWYSKTCDFGGVLMKFLNSSSQSLGLSCVFKYSNFRVSRCFWKYICVFELNLSL